MINTIGKKKLEGIIPALILPLKKNGEININFLKKQVNYLSSAGVNGIFVNGTTGEGGWLTIEEKAKIFNLVKEISEGKIFLCAACLQPSTEMVMNEIKIIEKYKPDYIVAVTPYYYGTSQEIIIEHFGSVYNFGCYLVF